MHFKDTRAEGGVFLSVAGFGSPDWVQIGFSPPTDAQMFLSRIYLCDDLSLKNVSQMTFFGVEQLFLSLSELWNFGQVVTLSSWIQD